MAVPKKKKSRRKTSRALAFRERGRNTIYLLTMNYRHYFKNTSIQVFK